jgi:hypothetical protein
MEPTRELIAHDLAVIIAVTDDINHAALTVVEVYNERLRDIFSNRELLNFWEELETEMQKWGSTHDIQSDIKYLQDFMELPLYYDIDERMMEDYLDGKVALYELRAAAYLSVIVTNGDGCRCPYDQGQTHHSADCPAAGMKSFKHYPPQSAHCQNCGQQYGKHSRYCEYRY